MTKHLLLTAAVVTLVSAPALAGFEWTPPPAPKAEPPPVAAPAAPVTDPAAAPPPVKPQRVEALPAPTGGAATNPHDAWAEATPAEPTPLLTPPPRATPPPAPPREPAVVVATPRSRGPVQPVAAAPKPAPKPAKPIMADPLTIDPFPLGKTGGPTAAASKPAPAAQATGGVQGFGADVPLALALRQVVPPGYAFSINPAVAARMGKPVSWDGKGRAWGAVAAEMAAQAGLSLTTQARTVVLTPAQ